MTGDTAASGWQTGVGAVLIVLLTIAVVSDWRQRRIPNVLVLVTLLAGIVFHTLGPQSSGTGGLFSTQPGALGAWRALAGAAVGLVLFLPFYVLRLLGAGDVKLLAAVGAFAGPSTVVNLALFVLLAGGVLALARMAWARNSGRVLRNTLSIVGQVRSGAGPQAPGFDAATQTGWRMPYAVAIAGGVVAYGAWTLSGRAPLLNL
jgi:prepilin peptidase CpaA